MIGLDLSRCVSNWFGPKSMCSEKAYKMRNNQHFTTACIWCILTFCSLTFSLYFLKLLTNSQNVKFHIHQKHLKIGSSEVIKFCTQKIPKKTHCMSPCKIINLFQIVVTVFYPYNVSYGQRCSPGSSKLRFKTFSSFYD